MGLHYYFIIFGIVDLNHKTNTMSHTLSIKVFIESSEDDPIQDSECVSVKVFLFRNDNSQIYQSSMYYVNSGTNQDLIRRGFICAEFDEIPSGEIKFIVFLMNGEMKVISKRAVRFSHTGRSYTITVPIAYRIPKEAIKGREFVAISNTRKRSYNLRFPNPFPYVANEDQLSVFDQHKVLVTANSNQSNGYNFATTVKDITNSGCIVDIYRIDGHDDNSGWLHETVCLDWIAW